MYNSGKISFSTTFFWFRGIFPLLPAGAPDSSSGMISNSENIETRQKLQEFVVNLWSDGKNYLQRLRKLVDTIKIIDIICKWCNFLFPCNFSLFNQKLQGRITICICVLIKFVDFLFSMSFWKKIIFHISFMEVLLHHSGWAYNYLMKFGSRAHFIIYLVYQHSQISI